MHDEISTLGRQVSDVVYRTDTLIRVGAIARVEALREMERALRGVPLRGEDRTLGDYVIDRLLEILVQLPPVEWEHMFAITRPRYLRWEPPDAPATSRRH